MLFLKGRTQKSHSRKRDIKSLQEFQPRLVSMAWLNRARLKELHSSHKDWQKRCFPPFPLPQPPHTFCGRCPLWQDADGWLAGHSANTRLAFEKKKPERILRKLVSPHKDTDKFVLRLIDIKIAIQNDRTGWWMKCKHSGQVFWPNISWISHTSALASPILHFPCEA